LFLFLFLFGLFGLFHWRIEVFVPSAGAWLDWHVPEFGLQVLSLDFALANVIRTSITDVVVRPRM
jgi:hypothetical protein